MKFPKAYKALKTGKSLDDDKAFNFDQAAKDVATLLALVSVPRGSNKLAKSVTLISGGLVLGSLGQNIFRYLQGVAQDRVFTLKIDEDDYLFNVAEQWLMDAVPEDKKRSVFVKTVWRSNGGGPSTFDWKVTYDGAIEQQIEIAGYMVTVGTEKGDGPEKKEDSPSKFDKFAAPKTIVFKCPSAAASNAVRDELVKAGETRSRRSPGFYTSRWGSFYRTNSISRRDKESVILKEGQMDRVINHIKQFRANEDEYEKYGIPFRTGIMLSGTPGSGKTSTATVVANELDMDVYYLSILAMEGDSDLEASIGRIPENVMVVLEDIDAVRSTKDRSEEKGAADVPNNNDVSLSALLNVLDGMQSPRGVVFVLTTNHPDKLDPALMRPGRVDLHEHLTALDHHQLTQMIEYYSGGTFDGFIPYVEPEDGISSAEVMQVIRHNLPNHSVYGEEIVKYISDKLLTKLDR
jgi:hypothetical protein